MKLLFLASKEIDPHIREDLRLPMDFVSFAIMKGKMFRFKREIYVADWVSGDGNYVVYGALYALSDDYFHIRTLDAMHTCSLSALGRNHDLDVRHRRKVKVNLIRFSSFDNLLKLKYDELDEFEVEAYIANIQHPTVQHLMSATQHYNFRVKSGILIEPYRAQYREAFKADE